MNIRLIIVTIAVGVITACAPTEKLLGIKNKRAIAEAKVDSLNTVVSKMKVENTELASKDSMLQKLADNNKATGDSLSVLNQHLNESNSNLSTKNSELLKRQAALMKDNAEESKRILTELQTSKEELQKREDKLNVLQKDLEKEKERLGKLSEDLTQKNNEISQKNTQLKDLQTILKQKDSITNALKNKISAALKGFEGNGLTIVQRDGKIYVSLDESLLFEVGKFEVSAKGSEAIQKLGTVLEKNPDINILVEGHTDNTGSAKLNWKLSTDRALAISTIILSNDKIDGKRVTAAGRGQFSPLDVNTTKEGRAKNRRCEIILSPKLDELYKLIEK